MLPEQLRILFTYTVPNILASGVVVFLFFYSLWGQFPTNYQYLWLVIMSLLQISRFFIYQKSLREEKIRNPEKWLFLYSVVMFFIGAAWGSLIFVPVELLEDRYLGQSMMVLLLSLMCISSISSSAHPKVIWSFLIPMGVLSSYYMFFISMEPYGFALGVGIIVICFVAGLAGHTAHNLIVKSLTMQSKNLGLMEEVMSIAKQNQKSYEGFQILLDNLGAGAAMFDEKLKIISWNKSFESIFNLPIGLIRYGMSLKEVTRKIIKQSWQDNIDINHAADVHVRELLSENKDDAMIKLVLADGRNLFSKVMKVNDDQIILNYTDVTSLEQARTKDIIHVLQHDNLTGLPNQVLVNKELKRRMTNDAKVAGKNSNDNEFFALIHVGLNSLNEIHEFLGPNAGDQVIAEMADRCKEFLNEKAYFAHIAYDEFQIITSYDDIAEIKKLTDDIAAVIANPFEINGNSISLTTSVGVSLYPEHSDKADVLSRNARIAYNKAKLPNEESVVIYDEGMHSEIMERSNMLFDIRESLKKSEFMLHYQPQMEVKSDQIMGVEALLRWQHPEKGWISPEYFIPLAEHSQQIIPLTEQFLPEACYQLKNWHDKGLTDIKMSVNISPFHFHDKEFMRFIRECIENAKLNPAYLDLEITEGVIMNQTEEVINTLHVLSEMGVKLSIDDFGTGYSSLSYLRSLPVDQLKIDQAFIKDMATDNSAHSLVEAIIKMGHSFDLNIVAEGVEDKEQYKMLSKLNCDRVQGYFVGRPKNADDTFKWISDSYK